MTSDRTNLARVLRKQQTEAEAKLWLNLRNGKINGVKFRRQQPVGNYIVDFINFEKRLVVEIDGGQHNEDSIIRNDEQRTRWLQSKGYRVMRFWNNEVMSNIDGVVQVIREAIKENHPHP